MYLQTLLILLSIGSTFCDFLPVHDGCKYWNFLKVYGNGDIQKLHCILDQDFQPGLVYTYWKMIPNGFCPIYNRFAKEIDFIPCNGNIGICPKDSIPSYSGVTFTGCYDAIRKQTNVIRPTTNVESQVPPATSDQQTNVIRPTTNVESQVPPATSDHIALIVVATLFGITICMVVVCCSVGYFIYKSKVKKYRETCETSRGRNKEARDNLPLLPENVMPREQGQLLVLNTMRGNEYLVTNASTLGNGIQRNQGQRRVLNTMRDEEYLVTNASTLVADNYERVDIITGGRVAYQESRPENVIQREQGQRRVLNTMRGYEFLVNNASPLVADNHEEAKIIEDDLADYLESKPTADKYERVDIIEDNLADYQESKPKNVIPRKQGRRRFLNTMSANENLVTNTSTSVADNHEEAKIIEDDLSDYHE